jgi:hypothetical protein
LSKYISNNLSSYSPGDSQGTTITAAQGNNVLKAIAVLGVVNASTASNPLAVGNPIAVKIVNDAYAKIKVMEDTSQTATSGSAGCNGACQGFCL